MQARMKNPATLVPEAMQALMALAKCVKKDTVPEKTLNLVHLRASQINGCAFCIDLQAKDLQKGAETPERALAVSAWRDSPLFNDAERAALALAEAMTRLNDRADAVSDDVWNEAARHYDAPALAQLVMFIATTNLWNRLNVTTRQVPGSGW